MRARDVSNTRASPRAPACFPSGARTGFTICAFGRWALLVVDEGHRLKTQSSKLFQALRMFDTRSRLLLTGTPLQNNLDELWTLLHFLQPKTFADLDTFAQRFESLDRRAAAMPVLSSSLMALLVSVLSTWRPPHAPTPMPQGGPDPPSARASRASHPPTPQIGRAERPHPREGRASRARRAHKPAARALLGDPHEEL